MALSRISTYALHQSTLQNAGLVQARLADLQTQLSSGLKSQDFQGIASRAEQFISLDNKLARSNMYLDTNQVVQTRIDTTNTVLDQVIGTVTDLKNLILQRRSATGNSAGAAFQTQLEGHWKSLVSQLNTELEGRYLFSGDRTDTPPINSVVFPLLLTPGEPDEGYYMGGSGDVTLQADDTTVMTYNVRANEEGFQKVFAALSMAKQGDEHLSEADLEQAYTLVQEGLEDIIATQATVNSNKVALDQINLRQQSLQIYWKSVKEEIVNTDLVAVSTQVAIDQGILQASFQSFARINSLRLVDYLQ